MTAGGNKTRRLEFQLADAPAQGADTLISCGAVQSNHCRLTLAAAVKEGRKGYFKKGENVLFVQTGGSPGLYAYIKPLLGLEKVADERVRASAGHASQKKVCFIKSNYL